MSGRPDLLEHAMDLFPAPSHAFGALEDRRRRHRRRQRITAAVVAFLVAAGGTAAIVAALGSTTHAPRPAGTDEAGTWTAVPLDPATFPVGIDLRAVTAWSGGFVAVGDSSVSDDESPVWTSPDGATWSRVPSDTGPQTDSLWGVTAFGDQVVAVGVANDLPAAWISSDGVMWDAASVETTAHGDADAMFHVSAEPGGLLVASGRVAEDGYVWTSADGRTWEPADGVDGLGGPGEQFVADVAEAGPNLIAAGYRGTPDEGWQGAMWSFDGDSWTALEDSDAAFTQAGTNGIGQLLWDGSTMLALGMSNQGTAQLWMSRDGLTYQQVPEQTSLHGARLTSIQQTPDGFVAVGSMPAGGGSMGGVWTSSDGFTWTRGDSTLWNSDDPAADVADLAAGVDALVAVGTQDTAGAGAGAAIWTTATPTGGERMSGPTGASGAGTTPGPTAATGVTGSGSSPSGQTGARPAAGTPLERADADLGTGDHLDLDTSFDGSDITWTGSSIRGVTHESFVQRLDGADFGSVGGDDLQGLMWARSQPEPVVEQIAVGDVLAVWTTAGNFAKVDVTSIGERLSVRYVTYVGTHPPCWAPAEESVPTVDEHGDTVVSFSNAMVLCGTFTFDLETGATGGGGMDLWWEQIDGIRAVISSDHGPARFANLGSADYDALTAADLAGLSYQDQEIRTEYNDSNVLVPGDVFAVRTGGGNLAKVQVLVFGYDLEIRYVTYAAP